VCLVLEGTYPFVSGGVSSWTHDLLNAQHGLRFHLVCLLPPGADLRLRYELPANVLSLTVVPVGKVPERHGSIRQLDALLRRLEPHLARILTGGGLADIAAVLRELEPVRNSAGAEALLDSPAAWQLLTRMYESTHADSAFLDYFWTWRALLGGLYSMLLCDLPPALVYHPVCTGYAGLFAARAHIGTGRPVILTEHGIYTNERRIEIGMADWLYENPVAGFQIERTRSELRDLWMGSFSTYSRACYEACTQIITLYEGNQQFQIEDGAAREKLAVIPNGIDTDRYSGIVRDEAARPPTIALIGRVVPIKDVKTFIRAVAALRGAVPDVEALVLGPIDEDPEYFADCEALVGHLALEDVITFTGRVALNDYLGRIDLLVLTSISEAQPLVILEAGAAGVPSVATDVGACREMIYGSAGEPEQFGAAGEVIPLADPVAAATAIARLLLTPGRLAQASEAARRRVRRYYDKQALDSAYSNLYRSLTLIPA
jgi:glycosyltransferase involved in cell wall biosynthesis